MQDVNQRLAALSGAKKALFEAMLQRQGIDTAGGHTTARATEIRAGEQPRGAIAELPGNAVSAAAAGMEFSLMFFSGDGSAETADKYSLLIESARFADQHGFAGVWTPERHFHAFGGLFPNPSIIAAALATITRNIQLRAGSVVLPLHDPVRVVEEWSVVDNLSNGRACLSFASGWHEKDFVLAPGNYAARKEVTFRHIETVKRLWAGEALPMAGVGGKETVVKTFPRPLQTEMPFWVTAATSAETFARAGEVGAHVLTGLTGQRLDEVAGKVRLYREARARAGLDPATGKVALMLHTFLGAELGQVREIVRQPMYDYLRSNLGLHEDLARSRSAGFDREAFTGDDERTLLEYAFERYFNGSALLGTPESCLPMVARVQAAGVTEIACLLDFGLDRETVIAGLEPLDQLRQICARPAARAA